MEITVQFVREKETKNAVRFEEAPQDGEPTKFGTIYIQKWVVQRLGNPREIEVTVSSRPAG